jgi:MMP 1-O-methyltransferase
MVSQMQLISELKSILKPLVFPPYYRLRHGSLGKYLVQARPIKGWTTKPELLALAHAVKMLPANALIVEIGAFLGRSTVVLAGMRKLQGSGKVHCIDPFDASGDSHSVPIYQEIVSRSRTSQRENFDEYMRRAGVTDWVEVYQGTAESVAATWTEKVDMLFLDGDQSPVGVRSAYERWSPFLKAGGIIAVHNSADRVYQPEHDGSRLLVLETIRAPDYKNIYRIDSTTFATKVTEASAGASMTLPALERTL